MNALLNSATLTFSPGLTVIYGGNGTGKSGFARLLSNVCFSWAQHRILPNVYEDAGGRVPAADITVIDGSQVERSLPLDQAKNEPDLKRIAVFDTSVARAHLVDENPLGFKPVGFGVFPELGRVHGELAKRLNADIERRSKENNFTKSFVPPPSAVSEAIASLSAETAIAPLQELGKFGDAEKARFEEVQRQIVDLQAKSPIETLKQLTEAKSDLVALEKRLAEACEILNDAKRVYLPTADRGRGNQGDACGRGRGRVVQASLFQGYRVARMARVPYGSSGARGDRGRGLPEGRRPLPPLLSPAGCGVGRTDPSVLGVPREPDATRG